MRPAIVFDIETKSDQRVLTPEYLEEVAQGFEAPKNFKDPLKIKAKIDEKLDSFVGKAGLNAQIGRICSIAWADLYRGEIDSSTSNDEEFVLQEFADYLEGLEVIKGRGPVVCGYNVRAYDVPFLSIRCAIHKVDLPSWWPSHRDWQGIQDPLDIFGRNAGDGPGKLDGWLHAFGLPPKMADGSEVEAMPLEEVGPYNRHDVHVERLLMQRIKGLCPNLREVSRG